MLSRILSHPQMLLCLRFVFVLIVAVSMPKICVLLFFLNYTFQKLQLYHVSRFCICYILFLQNTQLYRHLSFITHSQTVVNNLRFSMNCN
jgi:hypothetical protein